MTDVLGLDLNPPENVLLACLDERSQTAQDTRPMLPLRLGYVEDVTVRRGTITLFKALNVASGAALTAIKFIVFLCAPLITRCRPRMYIDASVNNYSAHNHHKVNAWRRPACAAFLAPKNDASTVTR